MDRLLARLEQQRIWEHVPEAVDLDIRIATDAMALASEVDQDGKPVATPTVRLRAWALVHQIVKETFIDRTIPTVARVDATAAIMSLPMAEGELPEQVQGQTAEQTSKQESIALLRGVIALLQQGTNGNGAKPGLVILRDAEDRRAG